MIRTPNINQTRGIPIVSNGHILNTPHHNGNTNHYRARQRSFDTNQILTYCKVIERVIKRFLLHKQREEQEEIREGDFEELKQDSHLLNEGVVIVGELLSTLTRDTNPLIKENFQLFKSSFYSTTDSGVESTSSTCSTISMPNLMQQIHSSASIFNSKSAPSLFSINQEESDINPINAVRHLSAVQVRLSNITEENESIHNSLKYMDDDEEEVDARHVSIQTSMEDDNSVVVSKF
jgi:hypothetical protein